MHWREKELLNVLNKGKFTTSELVSRVNMSKVTALKYLSGLEEKKMVNCEEIGTAKLWYLKTAWAKVGKKIKVLVADDDKNVINIIRYSIEPDQFEILEATNGKEVLGMVFAETFCKSQRRR